MVLIPALFVLIRSLILSRTALTAENLALCQQLTVLNRKIHRPQWLKYFFATEPFSRGWAKIAVLFPWSQSFTINNKNAVYVRGDYALSLPTYANLATPV